MHEWINGCLLGRKYLLILETLGVPLSNYRLEVQLYRL
jgi:hypothetical protein